MNLQPKKALFPGEVSPDGTRTAEISKIDKAKLTIFVNDRGIQVGAKITLRNGQDIRLSFDEALELRNLLSTLY